MTGQSGPGWLISPRKAGPRSGLATHWNKWALVCRDECPVKHILYSFANPVGAATSRADSAIREKSGENRITLGNWRAVAPTRAEPPLGTLCEARSSGSAAGPIGMFCDQRSLPEIRMSLGPGGGYRGPVISYQGRGDFASAEVEALQ